MKAKAQRIPLGFSTAIDCTFSVAWKHHAHIGPYVASIASYYSLFLHLDNTVRELGLQFWHLANQNVVVNHSYRILYAISCHSDHWCKGAKMYWVFLKSD